MILGIRNRSTQPSALLASHDLYLSVVCSVHDLLYNCMERLSSSRGMSGTGQMAGKALAGPRLVATQGIIKSNGIAGTNQHHPARAHPGSLTA
jgi:hypothetical protein